MLSTKSHIPTEYIPTNKKDFYRFVSLGRFPKLETAEVAGTMFGENQALGTLGAFMVKRAVMPCEDDIFTNSLIDQKLAEYRDFGTVVTSRSLTVLNRLDANITRATRTKLGDEDFLNLLVNYLHKLPKQLVPKSSNIRTFGETDPTRDGLRHVALTLDPFSRTAVVRDRLGTLSLFGAKTGRKEMPHISLFRTFSHDVATDLERELNLGLPHAMPVMLGRPKPKRVRV